MSIYQIFVINRAGSLIYDWQESKDDNFGIEKTFSYPLDIIVDVIDQKVTVIFGERNSINVRYVVAAINGVPVHGTQFSMNNEEIEIMSYLSDEKNYPLNIRFVPPSISTNEKIILSSTFHSLFTIAAQLSPVKKSSGIEVLTTTRFVLHCFQSLTGVKFIVVGALTVTNGFDKFLYRLYDLYADFALKNPFYSIDMPIRCQRFDDGVKALVDEHEKLNMRS